MPEAFNNRDWRTFSQKVSMNNECVKIENDKYFIECMFI